MKHLLRKRRVVMLVLLGLLCLAAVLRVSYYRQLSAGSGAWQHLWPESDMHYFDSWARNIVGGDLLSAELDPPMHGWQVAFAEIYAERQSGAMAASPISAETARELWTGWMGRGGFYQDPLYAYLLAGVYGIDRLDHRPMLIIQQLLGLATILLLYFVAKRSFGPTVALVTMVLAILYPMALYYELFLLRETFLLFFSLLLVYLSQRIRPGRQVTLSLLFGLVSGWAILLKSSLAALILLLCLGMAVQARRPGAGSARSLRPVVLTILGLCIAFLPLWYRNLTLGLPLAWATREGSFVFALHNVSTYPPMGGDVFSIDLLQMMADVMTRSGFGLFQTMIESVGTHGSLWAYIVFLWEKFLYVWYWYEVPNNTNFYYYQLQAPVLTLLPLTFGVLAPLALPGMVLAARRWRRCWQLYTLVGVNLLFLVLFLNVSRLKMPLAIALLPFAALTLVRFWRMVRCRNFAGLVGGGLVVVLLALWINHPLPEGNQRIRPDDYYIPLSSYYWPRIDELSMRGEHSEALRLCAESLRVEPRQDLASLVDGATQASESELDVARIFYEANQKCAAEAELVEGGGRMYAERAARLAGALDRFLLFDRP